MPILEVGKVLLKDQKKYPQRALVYLSGVLGYRFIGILVPNVCIASCFEIR